jgi:hypothetical protein
MEYTVKCEECREILFVLSLEGEVSFSGGGTLETSVKPSEGEIWLSGEVCSHLCKAITEEDEQDRYDNGIAAGRDSIITEYTEKRKEWEDSAYQKGYEDCEKNIRKRLDKIEDILVEIRTLE